MAVQKSKKSVWKKKLKVFNQISILVKKYFIPLNISVKNIHFKLFMKRSNLKLNKMFYLKNIYKYSLKLNTNYIKLYNWYWVLGNIWKQEHLVKPKKRIF